MWSSFLDQIQQRIDDAAELLGDEEYEETQLEAGGLPQPPLTQPRSGQAGSSVTPKDNSNYAPLATIAAVVQGNAQGWEREDLDDLISSTAASTRHLTSPPAVAKLAEKRDASTRTLTVTAAAAAAPVLTLGASTKIEKNHEELREEDAAAESVVDSAHFLRVSSQETLATIGKAIAAAQLETPPALLAVGELPTLPSSAPAEQHAINSFAPLDSADAPRSTAAAASIHVVEISLRHEERESTEKAEKPEEVEERVESSRDAPDAAIQGTSTPANLAAAEQQTKLSGESAPTRDETLLSSPFPLLSTPVKESSGVEQLLRFQQQLAEEMESVTTLEKENSFLKRRVSDLEGEISSVNARLVAAAGSEEQISLLIEKLGKEKERHKAAASECSRLEEHVQELEEELEEYRAKEQGWIGGSEQQKQNENAAQQRIAQLERELRERDSLIDDLNAKLHETTHQNSVLQHRVEELKASYSTQLDKVRESNFDTVDQLRREVEQLRSSLQSLSTEYDTRTAELEREVQQSNVRAHQAEARFNEVEFGSVNTLQDLRNELEDSQRSIATWKTEAQKSRSEYTELLDQYAVLKRSCAAAETHFRERLAAEAAALSELRKGLRDGEARYQALQETLRTAQAESEDQRETIMLLEAANQKLMTATSDNFAHSHNETSVNSASSTKRSSLEASLPSSPFSSRPAGRAAAARVPMNPFVNRERPVWNDTTDRKTRERLEQEVLRQSMELEKLRQALKENVEWKNKFLQLQTEHDLLLQLYGQLEDDMTILKSKTVAVPPAPPADSPAISSTPSP